MLRELNPGKNEANTELLRWRREKEDKKKIKEE